jgi:hypothetical protein
MPHGSLGEERAEGSGRADLSPAQILPARLTRLQDDRGGLPKAGKLILRLTSAFQLPTPALTRQGGDPVLRHNAPGTEPQDAGRPNRGGRRSRR